MDVGAKHIPVEIIHEILSSLSSVDLVSAGLVSRTFQAEADRHLYRSVGYLMSRAKIVSFLDTTAAVKRKAVLVKSLCIELDASDWGDRPIIERLPASLSNMTALTNLVLLLYIHISEYWRDSLVQALQRSTFSLTSFYTTLDLGFGSFIPNLTSITSLRYFVFAFPFFEPSKLSLCRTLIEISPPENRLCIFALSYDEGEMSKEVITSFPAFDRDWSAAPIKEVLPSLFQHSSVISHFILYIDTLSDHEHLRQYFRSISDNFPGAITNLELYVRDHRIDENPEELASTLSCLTVLSELWVCYWETDGGEVSHSSLDDKVDLARRWSAQCPSLFEVTFPNWFACVANGEGTSRSWSLD